MSSQTISSEVVSPGRKDNYTQDMMDNNTQSRDDTGHHCNSPAAGGGDYVSSAESPPVDLQLYHPTNMADNNTVNNNTQLLNNNRSLSGKMPFVNACVQNKTFAEQSDQSYYAHKTCQTLDCHDISYSYKSDDQHGNIAYHKRLSDSIKTMTISQLTRSQPGSHSELLERPNSLPNSPMKIRRNSSSVISQSGPRKLIHKPNSLPNRLMEIRKNSWHHSRTFHSSSVELHNIDRQNSRNPHKSEDPSENHVEIIQSSCQSHSHSGGEENMLNKEDTGMLAFLLPSPILLLASGAHK